MLAEEKGSDLLREAGGSRRVRRPAPENDRALGTRGLAAPHPGATPDGQSSGGRLTPLQALFLSGVGGAR